MNSSSDMSMNDADAVKERLAPPGLRLPKPKAKSSEPRQVPFHGVLPATAYRCPFAALSLAFLLPYYCPFTARSLPVHCRFLECIGLRCASPCRRVRTRTHQTAAPDRNAALPR